VRQVSEVATNLLLEMKYLDTRFPRIAEAHMRTLRAQLAKKGIDAGASARAPAGWAAPAPIRRTDRG